MRRARSMRTLRYGRALGFLPLREAIADYVRRARGVAASVDQVVVVNGSQQALDLVARLVIDRGDRVVIGYACLSEREIRLGVRLLSEAMRTLR
jgi:GntR family transcriptional regulator / MocR family aminotransferase